VYTKEERADTLRSLNSLGRTYNVKFDDALLFMRPSGSEIKVHVSKAEGVRYFKEKGYRLFAFVDNEPINLTGVAEGDAQGEILLLHADAIYESERRTLPPHSVSGNK